jgi:hypothetical protein
MAATPGPAPNTTAPRKHIGILVIHGMGEENPYGPLGQFVQGLYKHFQKPVYNMQTEWKERGSDPSHEQKSWTQAQIRFEEPDNAPQLPNRPPRLTVAEYYWSPATKGKLKDVAVLTWLIRTGLEPFRYLNENLQVMEAAGQPSPVGKVKRRAFILWRELCRMLVVYPLLILSFIAVAAFLSHAPQLTKILGILETQFAQGSNHHGPWFAMTIALLIAFRLLIIVSLALYFVDFLSWLRYRLPQTAWHRRYNWYALVGALVLLAVAIYAPAFWMKSFFKALNSGPCPPGLPTLASLPNPWRSWLEWFDQILLVGSPLTCLFIPLVELGLAAVIRNFLINYLGDVAIYTNLNQRQANFKVRAQILEECGHAVTSLYTDLRQEALAQRRSAATLSKDDFEIVIAAHSLGTVIAYDTINDLFNRARIGAPAAGVKDPPPGKAPDPFAFDICKHLRGLLTFGSPLNKTYYFFRDQSEAQELIRAQVIDQLHSFRLLGATGKLTGAPLDPVPVNPLQLQTLIDSFRWLNVWATMDIFSGKLFFYKLDPKDQLHRWYWKPVFAHLSYWTDEKMYAFFAKNLLS